MKPEVVISHAGAGIEHGARFVVDRPEGSGDHVFIHFTTEVKNVLLAVPGLQRSACILKICLELGIHHPDYRRSKEQTGDQPHPGVKGTQRVAYVKAPWKKVAGQRGQPGIGVAEPLPYPGQVAEPVRYAVHDHRSDHQPKDAPVGGL